MRIAYVCTDRGVPVFGSKGCSIHVQEVLRSLRSLNHDVTLLATRRGGSPPHDLEKVRRIKLPRTSSKDTREREQFAIAANDQIEDYLQHAGPFDFLYERFSLFSHAAMEFAAVSETAAVLEVNAPRVEEQAAHRKLHDPEAAEESARRAFAAATTIVAVSEEVADWVALRTSGSEKIHVVPNGVCPRRFSPDTTPTCENARPFTVGFVGSLRPWHALEHLIDAYAKLHTAKQQTRLLIIGDGPQREPLHRRIADLPPATAATVQFTDAVSPAEVPAWLTALDVAVAPYAADQQFYFSPLKVFEYMAAGRAIVASGVGQLRSVIDHRQTGLLTEPGDAQSLADALIEIHDRPQWAQRMGAAARQAVLEKHTWNQTTSRILAISERNLRRSARIEQTQPKQERIASCSLSMPHAANQKIAARDRALPGLSLLLDAEALQSKLNEADRGPSFNELMVRYVRYKPGRRCLIAYSGTADGEPVDFYAVAVTPDSWPRRETRHLTDASVREVSVSFSTSKNATFPLTLADCTVLVYPPGCDGRLKALPRLFDRNQLNAMARQALGKVPGDGPLQMAPLVHKPERRFVARIHNGTFSAVIKCYTPPDFVAARRSAKTLRSGSMFRIAAALGRSRRRSFMILPWLEGTLLRETLWQNRATRMDLERTGGAIAQFHQQRSKRLQMVTSASEAAAIAKAGDDVGFLLPDLENRIAHLAHTTAKRIAELSQQSQPIHGDFYSKQVVVTPESIGLLDLDEAYLGDPLADLANFAAHLETYVLRGEMQQTAADSARAALLEGYQHLAGSSDERVLKLRTVAALIKLLHAPFRNGLPDWPQRIERTLQRAEQLAADVGIASFAGVAQCQPAKEVSDPSGAAADSSMPFLAEALNPTAACRVLRDAVNDMSLGVGSIGQLNSIRVLRHNPGRRCLIEYSWQLGEASQQSQACLGKVRAKGLDRTTPALHEQLRQSGLDERGEVVVPQPLRCVPQWRMWLQRKVTANPLDETQLAERGAALGRRIVNAIDAVHRAKVDSEKWHTIDDELRVLSTRLQKLSSNRPALSSQIENILEGCQQLAGSRSPSTTCGIHRDFYQDHVLLHGAQTVLVDFDLYCMGDPALDIGNFIGHLQELSLRTFGTTTHYAEVAAAMLEHFAELRGEAARHNAEIYTSLTLARHLEISQRFADRASILPALLEVCSDRLGCASRSLG